VSLLAERNARAKKNFQSRAAKTFLTVGHSGTSDLAKQNAGFLCAFAKLRKATIRFVTSVSLYVRLSVRMEQLGSHWTDFRGARYLSTFRKSAEKIQVSLKSEKNNGYFT